MESAWHHLQSTKIRVYIETRWPGERTPGQRGYPESNGDLEKYTGFYGQQRPTCDSITSIKDIAHIWPVWKGGKKKAVSQKGLSGTLFEVCKTSPRGSGSKLAESFVVRWNKNRTFWHKCQTLCLVKTQRRPSPNHQPSQLCMVALHNVVGMFLLWRD